MKERAEGSYFKDTGQYFRNSVTPASKSNVQVVTEQKVLQMAM